LACWLEYAGEWVGEQSAPTRVGDLLSTFFFDEKKYRRRIRFNGYPAVVSIKVRNISSFFYPLTAPSTSILDIRGKNPRSVISGLSSLGIATNQDVVRTSSGSPPLAVEMKAAVGSSCLSSSLEIT
jgi:hypothetical protein